MFKASNVQYGWSDRNRGMNAGGLGAMHLVAQQTGLAAAIDGDLELLRAHLPYHESDHVLNLAYNLLCGGTCIEDLELRRNDEVYLDALGARTIPDPTTAGDFCRRFEVQDVEALMETVNRVRLEVWRQQPASFFDEAILDADGTLAPTTGERKAGMDISYDGVWGYHPLVVSLANTAEPLYLVNRSANRPSSEGASDWLDQSIGLCREAGFREILLRGDTDFSQTAHLDRWHRAGVRFLFGMDAMPNLVALAESLGRGDWRRLDRPPRYEVQTEPRARRENVKEQVVRDRAFRNIRLQSESVADFGYRPGACQQDYRMIVVRKNLSVEQGDEALFDDVRYFFSLTNDFATPAAELVLLANRRCNQENLIEQLKNGVRALRMPVDNLVSNWAYMVIASLAWTLKAWYALLLPEDGRWAEKHRAEKYAVLAMEFKTFVNAFIRLPCQIVRTGRHILFRLLSWNPWQHVLLRSVDALRQPLRC